MIRDLLKGAEQRVTERAGRDGYAKFSPDGDYLAWHSVINKEFSVIRLLNLESGELSAFSCRDWSGEH